MTETLLATKFFLPPTRPNFVHRARLVEKLNAGLHRRVALISAPAGFGKTTLVSGWLSQLIEGQRGEVKAVWLSLDEGDNDLVRFLTYFVHALNKLDSANNEIGNTALSLLRSPQLPSSETILTSVINEIAASNMQIVFVLDDYHLIDAQPVHSAMNFLIENIPAGFQLVILTREDPPVPLAKLRARDHLTELRSAELRFREAEARNFLNEIMELNLNKESVAVLEGRTEGWIAGLQMAALSIQEHRDVQGFIAGFSGTNRFILDYLLEEVLESRQPEVQNFLLATSILKRLSAPLCDAVMDGAGQSSAMLEHLERANLFLLPLDDERRWYRYHHLFADLLKARLTQTFSAERLAELHARAARWYEENRMIYEAIYHASSAADVEWVERLIDENYMEIFQRKDSASIRYWTGELSEELIFQRPNLCIHEANSRAWFGKLDEADMLLDKAEERLLAKKTTPESEALLGYLAYVRSRVTAMRGDFDTAIALCLSAKEKTPASNQGLLGGIGVMLGYGYFLNGEFLNAARTLEETIQAGKNTGAINTTVGAYCVLARLYAIQGKLHRSFALYREAEAFINEADGQHRGAMSIVDVGFAEILYEWHDLDSALTYIRKGLDFISLWSKSDDTALAHVIFARLLQAQGNFLEAENAIRQADHVVRSSGVFSEAQDAVLSAGIRLSLNKRERPDGYLVSLIEKRTNSGQLFLFKDELALITLARAYLAQEKLDACLELLSGLGEGARAGGRTGRLIEILMIQALAMQRKGNAQQAVDSLTECLQLAEREEYVRVFLNEGKAVHDLLLVMKKTVSKDLLDYANQLIALFKAEEDIKPIEKIMVSQSDMLVEPLSPREIEVLALIAEGLTNKEIAGQLVVSPGTVKAHTSSIYRKLDVSNRTEAAARARSLDILS